MRGDPLCIRIDHFVQRIDERGRDRRRRLLCRRFGLLPEVVLDLAT